MRKYMYTCKYVCMHTHGFRQRQMNFCTPKPMSKTSDIFCVNAEISYMYAQDKSACGLIMPGEAACGAERSRGPLDHGRRLSLGERRTVPPNLTDPVSVPRIFWELGPTVIGIEGKHELTKKRSPKLGAKSPPMPWTTQRERSLCNEPKSCQKG